MRFKRPFFIVWLMLLYAGIAYGTGIFPDNAPVAKNGVLDFRKQTFDTKLPLNGQWLFYWQKFLDPKDTLNHTGKPINFPLKWNGYVYNGTKLPSFGYATYQLTVLLPKGHQPLRISVPDMYTAYRLFVNGELVAENGTISTSAKGFEPHWEYQAFNTRRNVDTLHLILQVANFVHSKGGVSKPLFIGKRNVIELDRRRAEAIDLLLTGCLLMGGFFFLGLYLLGNRDKAILLFSLYSIVYSYRIIGTDDYVMHTLLPGMSWYVTARLEYISLFLGIGMFGLYTRYIYPLDANKIAIYLLNVCCFAFALLRLW